MSISLFQLVSPSETILACPEELHNPNRGTEGDQRLVLGHEAELVTDGVKRFRMEDNFRTESSKGLDRYIHVAVIGKSFRLVPSEKLVAMLQAGQVTMESALKLYDGFKAKGKFKNAEAMFRKEEIQVSRVAALMGNPLEEYKAPSQELVWECEEFVQTLELHESVCPNLCELVSELGEDTDNVLQVKGIAEEVIKRHREGGNAFSRLAETTSALLEAPQPHATQYLPQKYWEMYFRPNMTDRQGRDITPSKVALGNYLTEFKPTRIELYELAVAEHGWAPVDFCTVAPNQPLNVRDFHKWVELVEAAFDGAVDEWMEAKARSTVITEESIVSFVEEVGDRVNGFDARNRAVLSDEPLPDEFEGEDEAEGLLKTQMAEALRRRNSAPVIRGDYCGEVTPFWQVSLYDTDTGKGHPYGKEIHSLIQQLGKVPEQASKDEVIALLVPESTRGYLGKTGQKGYKLQDETLSWELNGVPGMGVSVPEGARRVQTEQPAKWLVAMSERYSHTAVVPTLNGDLLFEGRNAEVAMNNRLNHTFLDEPIRLSNEGGDLVPFPGLCERKHVRYNRVLGVIIEHASYPANQKAVDDIRDFLVSRGIEFLDLCDNPSVVSAWYALQNFRDMGVAVFVNGAIPVAPRYEMDEKSGRKVLVTSATMSHVYRDTVAALEDLFCEFACGNVDDSHGAELVEETLQRAQADLQRHQKSAFRHLVEMMKTGRWMVRKLASAMNDPEDRETLREIQDGLFSGRVKAALIRELQQLAPKAPSSLWWNCLGYGGCTRPLDHLALMVMEELYHNRSDAVDGRKKNGQKRFQVKGVEVLLPSLGIVGDMMATLKMRRYGVRSQAVVALPGLKRHLEFLHGENLRDMAKRLELSLVANSRVNRKVAKHFSVRLVDAMSKLKFGETLAVDELFESTRLAVVSDCPKEYLTRAHLAETRIERTDAYQELALLMKADVDAQNAHAGETIARLTRKQIESAYFEKYGAPSTAYEVEYLAKMARREDAIKVAIKNLKEMLSPEAKAPRKVA